MNTRIVAERCRGLGLGEDVARATRRHVRRALRKFDRFLIAGEVGAAARMGRAGVRALLVLIEAQEQYRAAMEAIAGLDRVAWDADRERQEDMDLLDSLMRGAE